MSQIETAATEVPVAPRTLPRVRVRAIPATLRTPAACLVYMLVLIALAMGIDRAVTQRLFAQPYDYVPAYRSFPEYAMGVKMHQYANLPGPFDAIFIGNSRTLFGVDPGAFDDALLKRGIDVRTYNLAVPSVDVRFWQPFFTRYDTHKAPRHLFLGILPRDLDRRFTSGASFVQSFFASSGYADRNESKISRWADERMSKLYVLKGRAADLQLVNGSTVLHGQKIDLHSIHLASPLGQGALPRENVLTPAQLNAQKAKLGDRVGTSGFELGAQQVAALRALNTWIRSQGGCLTLYTTPLYYDREQWGTQRIRAGFTQAVRALLPTMPGLRFRDVGARVQGGYTAADFGDGDHLNRRGARLFSTQLANVLAPEMTSPCPKR